MKGYKSRILKRINKKIKLVNKCWEKKANKVHKRKKNNQEFQGMKVKRTCWWRVWTANLLKKAVCLLNVTSSRNCTLCFRKRSCCTNWSCSSCGACLASAATGTWTSAPDRPVRFWASATATPSWGRRRGASRNSTTTGWFRLSSGILREIMPIGAISITDWLDFLFCY